MPGENIQDWSTTAVNNGSADSSINFAEGQTRASVNDSARSMMAAHAKQRNMLNGSITTGGTGNDYTFTSPVGYSGTVPAGLRVLLKIDRTNTGAATMNMDGIGATAITSAITGALVAGDLVIGSYVEFIYNGTNWVPVADTTNKVNLGGDTITGPITVPTITNTGNITTSTLNVSGASALTSLTTSGNITTSGVLTVHTNTQIFDTGAERVLQFQVDGWRLSFQTASGTLIYFSNTVPLFSVSGGGDLTIVGNAFKPGGGVWTASSDLRIKNVLGDYTSGLDQIKDLAPIRYTFKGNDGEHAADGKEYIGLIAQDVEASMPEMVTTKAGKIDGKPVTDLRMLDTGPLIFALVNSVQELSERLEALEAKA